MLSSLFQICHSFIPYYSREDYEWIGVVRPEERNFEENENLAGLLDEWEVLKNEHPLDISTERIFELARKYHVTGGKWMFWAETGYRIDHLWAIVAKGIVSKKILSLHAKVNARNIPSNGPRYDTTQYLKDRYNSQHVVCIFNKNFLDFENLCELEKSIRDSGLKLPLNYKPDIFTYLDVYSNNPWGIYPIIYKSTYSILDKCGIIKSTFQ